MFVRICEWLLFMYAAISLFMFMYTFYYLFMYKQYKFFGFNLENVNRDNYVLLYARTSVSNLISNVIKIV